MQDVGWARCFQQSRASSTKSGPANVVLANGSSVSAVRARLLVAMAWRRRREACSYYPLLCKALDTKICVSHPRQIGALRL